MRLNGNKAHSAPATYDFRKGRGEEKNGASNRACLPLRSLRLGTTVSHEHLRQLRAAEMAEWELSGGDYLVSCSATP